VQAVPEAMVPASYVAPCATAICALPTPLPVSDTDAVTAMLPLRACQLPLLHEVESCGAT
jgi:hypothetical protein